ncbi:MAG: gamma-glutamyl-phosphate reductase, partial [Candidatus Omnitrophica bacterium]|nr:gamma-glutamyl-phosphate reductase [Candidatus Omnitrophota bacterium]
MALNTELVHIAQKAQKAARRMSEVSSDLKNRVLVEMARSLLKEKRLILEENGKDLASVKKKDLPQAMIERLCLDDRRIKGVADSLF